MNRGYAAYASADARIADEVGHVGAMPAFNHAHTAIDDLRIDPAPFIQCVPCKASVGPLPDIARDVEEPILIFSECADWTACLFYCVCPRCIAIVKRQRAAARITAVKAF